MEFSIRNAEIVDAEGIAELSGQLGYPASAAAMKFRLTEILSRQDHVVFVALDQTLIIAWIHGFYALTVESDAFIEIGGLVVDGRYRKQGIGKALVDKITSWSQAEKISKLRVRCNTIRTESHVFYEQVGFRLNKEQKIFDKRLT